ncbi:S-layer homology domain-containing protein [Ructibacterium gallinarum]|uniref:S-layer homology domain-containing protein n=1 Tax=Ructibacterium gallinarum TaxID=2779355 RepID=A0A9D5RBW4_9FIRM|nr:S-layer homology domain-containing protein [Ructibacterium gallinarum]MBE5040423.1 S-layer homology domain-containing protein [Ructibacterium gallinarum]
MKGWHQMGAGILAVLCLFGGTASAEGTVQCTQQGSKVTISGKLETTKPNEIIAITVLPEGKETTAAQQEDILYINQQPSQDGSFSFAFDMNGGTREATAWISREYGTEEEAYDFVYKSTEDITSAIADINAADTAEKMKQALQKACGSYTNAFVLGMDLAMLEQIQPPYTNIYQALVDGRPYSETDTTNAASIFESATLVEQLSQSRDAAWIQKTLEEKGSALGAVVDGDVFEQILSERIKEPSQVYDALALKTFENSKALRQAYMESILLTAVAYPKNGRFDVQYVLSSCKGELGISEEVNSIEALSDAGKVKAYENLTGKRFTSLQALEERLRELAKTTGSSTVISGGNSGGGGSRGGGISIQNPQGLEPVEPIVQETQQEPEAFSDMEDAAWAKEAVYAMYELGIINGKEDGMFAPNSSVTREEFLKMAVLTAGVPQTDKTVDFLDVPEDAWFYSFVQQGAAAGITNGVNAELFGVGQEISRQDMAVMVYRTAEIRGMEFSETEMSFTDADQIADYAKGAVAALYGAGIIAGNPDGSFAPNGTATRAEAAQMLYRLIGSKEE